MNPQMKFHLVFSFVMGALMISVMTGFITAINLGIGPGFAAAWARAFGLAYLVGVPTIFVLAPVARQITGRILGGAPAMPEPKAQDRAPARPH